MKVQAIPAAAAGLLLSLAMAGAAEPDAKLVAAARAEFSTKWAHFDLYHLKGSKDGKGLSGSWRGAEAGGRQCEATFSLRIDGESTTKFAAPEACLKPLTEAYAGKGEAVGALAAKCQQLDHAACGDLAFRGLVSREIPHLDFTASRLLAQPACERNSARGCVALAAALVSAKSLGADFTPGEAHNAEAFAATTKGCELGEPLGCVFLATVLLQKAPGIPQDVAKGTAMLREQCKAQVAAACQTLQHFGIAPE